MPEPLGFWPSLLAVLVPLVVCELLACWIGPATMGRCRAVAPETFWEPLWQHAERAATDGRACIAAGHGDEARLPSPGGTRAVRPAVEAHTW